MHALLVIEADEAQRHRVTLSLEQAGYKVQGVPSVEQALSLCQVKSPDVLILDPVQATGAWSAGVGVCLQHSNDATFVIWSDDASRASLLQALQYGAADYVLKDPAQYDPLLQSVRRVLATRQYRNQSKTHMAVRETLLTLEEDLRAGRHVQRSLLPPNPFVAHGIHADYQLHASLYLSGDLVDYFELQPGWFFFYILDVSGHGVASALITILLRNEMNRLRRDWHLGMDETIEHPHLVLLHLNALLQQSDLGKHATIWLGLLDVRMKTLSYANAGHYPYPRLLLDGVAQWIKQPKFPIGLFAEPGYETTVLQYDRQITIALCSDGVFEIMPETTLTERESLWADVVAREQFKVAQIAAALNVSASSDATDDMTILVISHGEDS